MCDGENRLKAGGGHGSLTGGKGEPTPETEPINKWGQSPFSFTSRKWGLSPFIWRVFEITILIIRHAFHHGFGYAYMKIDDLEFDGQRG